MAINDDEIAAHRQAGLEHLDAAETVLRGIAERSHPLIRDGKVVTDPETGDVVPDRRLNRKAAAGLESLARSRARLLGTDPPTVHRLTVPAGTSPEEVRRLAVELAIREQASTEDDGDDEA